jgi:ribose transport system ATP-binding protein
MPGKVHALVGSNGSGKSTLIKALAGVQPGDPGGHIRVWGSEVASDAITPRWARAAGLRFVHQDLGIFDGLSVAENIMADGGYPSRGSVVLWRSLRRQACHALERLDIEIPLDAPVSSLRPAQRTMLVIARALREEGATSVLVLDEPTASLPSAEADSLLTAVRGWAARGVAILLVSHRLEEVMVVADVVTALKDGEVAATRSMEGLDQPQLVEMIVGRPLDQVYPRVVEEVDDEPVVLEAHGLRGGAIHGIDLSVRRREILGIGGLVGSGRSSLLKMLFGLVNVDAGEILLDGERYEPSSPAGAISAGIAYLPEDRARDSVFGGLGVTPNLTMVTLRKYWNRFRMDGTSERRDAARDIADLAIRTTSPFANVLSLSGGNQQKVVLARWFRRANKLLLLDEPTAGVDIGSRSDIYRMIRAAAAHGTAVIIVSSDFEELAGVCDRVVVINRGRLVADAKPPIADRHWIDARAHGLKEAML